MCKKWRISTRLVDQSISSGINHSRSRSVFGPLKLLEAKQKEIVYESLLSLIEIIHALLRSATNHFDRNIFYGAIEI